MVLFQYSRDRPYQRPAGNFNTTSLAHRWVHILNDGRRRLVGGESRAHTGLLRTTLTRTTQMAGGHSFLLLYLKDWQTRPRHLPSICSPVTWISASGAAPAVWNSYSR